MLKLVTSIGNAAYKTAAKTGIAAGSEQPPYPCALPLQVVEGSHDLEQIEAVLDAAYDSVRDMLRNMPILNNKMTDPKLKKKWKKVDYTDNEGDLHLFTRHHVGPYNFARATMSLINVHPSEVLSGMHVQELHARKQYSPNLCEYDILFRNPELPTDLFKHLGDDNKQLVELADQGIRNWHMEYNQYYAPPPVSSREFYYLVEKRYVPEEDSYYIYGTSIDYRGEANRKTGKCVRGAVMFGWELTFVGDTTMATYVSCMNPGGWAPTFIVGWMKSEIGKELQNSRQLLYSQLSGGAAEAAVTCKRRQCLNSAGAGATEVEVERRSFLDDYMAEDARMEMEDERLFDVDEYLIIVE